MNILLTPGVYLPHQRAGSEIALHNTVKYLMQQGHQVKCIARCPQNYTFDGIEVYAHREDWKSHYNDLWNWADLVFTQLSGTGYSMNKSRQMSKKVISFAHNNAGYPQIGIRQNVYPVYNCENTKRELGYNKESFVLHPPVDYRNYEPLLGEYITLVNHNENKGGYILIEIAKQMPEHKFMAVQGGYYQQILSKQPNIKYVPMVTDLREYLKQTKIIIAPSEYESWGQAQVEAMCCGIPVIGSDIAGFRDSLGADGNFVRRNDVDAWVKAIKNVLYDYENQSAKALKRAKELDPTEELSNFNIWLEKICKLPYY